MNFSDRLTKSWIINTSEIVHAHCCTFCYWERKYTNVQDTEKVKGTALLIPLIQISKQIFFLDLFFLLFSWHWWDCMVSLGRRTFGRLIVLFVFVWDLFVVFSHLFSLHLVMVGLHCTMVKLKNGVKRRQLWQIISPPIFNENLPNFERWCINI